MIYRLAPAIDRIAFPALLVVFVLGCGQTGPSEKNASARGTESKKQSLYDRLGGEKGISKVVDDLVVIVVADNKYKDAHKKHFKEGDVAGLKKKLVDQIGEATGGPQKYTGKNMKDAHKSLAISNADFDTLVADLTMALDQNHVGKAEKEELLALLAPMRKDIVENDK